MRSMALARTIVVCVLSACAHDGALPVPAAPVAPRAGVPPRIEFARDVGPIVARCQPCHFPGGVMYQALPFDRGETIRLLGPKLFTRIKDPEAQSVIRRYLSQTD